MRSGRAFCAALSLALAACASDSVSRPAPIVSTVVITDAVPLPTPYDLSDVVAATGESVPRIWFFEKNGAQLALFGTMHVTPYGLRWLSPEARRAFESADLVLTEVGMSNAEQFNPAPEELQALSPLLVRKDQRDLRDRVAAPGTPERAVLDAALEMTGLPGEKAALAQPWTACLDLFNGVRPGAQARLSREVRDRRAEAAAALGQLDRVAPDARIEHARLSRGLAHQPLETFVTRTRVYATMSDDEALDCVRNMSARIVAGADYADLPARFSRALTQWRSGDADGARRTEETRTQAMSRALSARLLQAREADWLAAIERVCAGPKRRCAVAVGFAHLGGDDGMLKELARRGWRPAGAQS